MNVSAVSGIRVDSIPQKENIAFAAAPSAKISPKSPSRIISLILRIKSSISNIIGRRSFREKGLEEAVSSLEALVSYYKLELERYKQQLASLQAKTGHNVESTVRPN